MSTGESKNTYTADEVKAEVRQTIGQLSDLTRSDISFDEFCQTVLTKIVKLTGGHGAVLWQSTGNTPPRITHKAGHQTLEIPVENSPHAPIAASVISNKEPLAISSETIENDQNPLSEGLPYLLLFAPVFNRSKVCCGSLQLLQRHSISDSAKAGYLKFLSRIAELFPRWHENNELSRLSQNAENMSSTMDFITEVHKSINFDETAFAIANESRRVLAADRVSVAKWNGSSCKVVSVSSQDKFDNRSNVIRKLGQVATSSVSIETPFWITGETEGLAPNIVKKINDYMDESHSRTLIVLPLLKRPEENVDTQFQPGKQERPKKLGALIIEFFDTEVLQEQIASPCNLVVQQSELAMANAASHNEIFLLPLWTRIGRLQHWLLKDHYSKTMTALGALVFFLLLLTFFPKQLEMRVNGVLQPAVRKSVFAQTDGVIRTIHVDHGDVVAKDQLLVELENPDLDMKISQTENHLRTLQAEAKIIIGIINGMMNDTTDPEYLRLERQLKQMQVEGQGMTKNLQLMQKKKSAQRITAPISGTVLTWDFQNRNLDRPVAANDPVVSIGDKKGEWHLELEIPEGKLNYIREAQGVPDNAPLDVNFRLATNPNLIIRGKLINVAKRLEMSQSTGTQYCRATVAIETDQLGPNDLRPGAGVTARIQCGRSSLGFSWFYQIIDYARMNVFF